MDLWGGSALLVTSVNSVPEILFLAKSDPPSINIGNENATATAAAAQGQIEEALKLAFASMRESLGDAAAEYLSSLDEVKPGDAEQVIDKFDEILQPLWETLPAKIEQALIDVTSEGAVNALFDLAVTDRSFFTSVNRLALSWARNRSAEMVGMRWSGGQLVENTKAEWAISETTRDSIQNLVADIFKPDEDGRRAGIPQLTDRIRNATDFSDARAETVARTEVKNAAIQGQWDAWKASGLIKEVDFIYAELSTVCELCIDLSEGSPYLLEECPHPVRDTHPNCNCSLVVHSFNLGEKKEVVKVTTPLSLMEKYRVVKYVKDLQKISDEEKARPNRDGEDDVFASQLYFNSDVTDFYFVPRPWECKVYGTVTLVKAADLIPSQTYIPRMGLLSYAMNMPQEEDGQAYLPNVVMVNGKAYVGQGHTRLGVQIAAGRENILVRRFDANPVAGLLKNTKEGGWIGVDFDGTLATASGDLDFDGAEVGEPIWDMVNRVKALIEEGQLVRIFTARVWTDGSPERDAIADTNRKAIEDWCRDFIGQVLPVTCEKDHQLISFYDDRARQAERNVGELAPDINK